MALARRRSGALLESLKILRQCRKYCTAHGTAFPSESEPNRRQRYWLGTEPLKTEDPEMFELVKEEKLRQLQDLDLIASENYSSGASLRVLASCLNNKSAEGYPGSRYYGGARVVDKIESLTQKRALEAFRLNPDEWGVNVQCLSGSIANFAVYTALLKPHDRLMGLDLPDGGHLTHGFRTATKRLTASSIYFESMPYHVEKETGLIGYDKLRESARLFRPRLIIAGASAYPRLIDYSQLRKIADENNAYLMADFAHISGLVAAGVIPSPFEYSDVVTTTCHKTLKGIRTAMAFYRIGVKGFDRKGKETYFDLKERIDSAVFPGVQGAPRFAAIGALGVALKQASSSDYVEYQAQVLKNAQAMAEAFIERGYKLVSGGTDNHLVVVDLRTTGIDGLRAQLILDEASISTNKNTCPGDTSAHKPGGIRLGACALTSRHLDEEDFETVVEFVIRGIEVGVEAKEMTGNSMKMFRECIRSDPVIIEKIRHLREDVQDFLGFFPCPGYGDI